MKKKFKTLISGSLIFLVIVGIACAFYFVQKTNHRLREAIYKLKAFPIELKVDFGSAGKPLFDQKIKIENNTSPKDAVSQVFPIMSGFACCSLKDLVAIDGVKIEPDKNKWWICLVNGSKRVSAREYQLKPGDRLEWKYIEEKECKIVS